MNPRMLPLYQKLDQIPVAQAGAIFRIKSDLGMSSFNNIAGGFGIFEVPGCH
jgi:hypothetical protein